MLYRFFRAVARLVVWTWAPTTLVHPDRFPATGPAILIGNHRSLLDGFLLVAMSDRRITFLAAGYLFKLPFVGWVLRQVAVPTGSPQAVRQALSCLNDGGLVAVFPEGGIRTADTLEGLGDSAAFLATRVAAPVIPLAIRGADGALPLGRYWPRRHPVTITLGTRRTLPPGLKRADLHAITVEWMAEIATL